MNIAFVANCTVIKTAPVAIDFALMHRGITASEWLEKLKGLPHQKQAQDLYKGMAFDKCKRIAEKVHADFFIASAGLGIVKGDDWVPSYNATFSNEVPVRICDRFGGSNAEWLRALTIERDWSKYDLVIACVADAYQVPVELTIPRNVLFITTSPGPLWSIVYDRRLNDPRSPYRGGDVDFKARAAMHYFDHVFPKTRQADLDLSQWSPAQRAKRLKITEAECIDWIRKNGDRRITIAHKTLLAQGIGYKVSRFREAFDKAWID